MSPPNRETIDFWELYPVDNVDIILYSMYVNVVIPIH